jgi:hypothetical protein
LRLPDSTGQTIDFLLTVKRDAANQGGAEVIESFGRSMTGPARILAIAGERAVKDWLTRKN